ncbi:hypothetical protein BCR41DRAFT_382781 [Lobosporangium transversale]|uniref:F-box domain-containing protein n=1 Tax=Lobosporangium transversale TaxID=64571 RepID=A0A1Y2H2P4_9FUNG|nr:hypothetical protein BCR41DRAFT_382781 [Lobosporangium transversale]ORZ28849.1 hypothetical protein BCR41DRAFT_382781 [Lobosporangium transversale]|eukprot:XP_021886522.1 hypothetical protein BCR41DRAFT_382781 [Lobosporangium transversale]
MSTKNAKTSRPTFHASSLCNCNMSKMSLNPLHLPEIIPLVGDFLYEKDLLNCVRVSKTFHNAFIGLLYRRITVEPSSRYPSGEALQKHKKHIEEILFQNVFPEEYTILQGCARLQSINYWSQFQDEDMAALLRRITELNRLISRYCKFGQLSLQELLAGEQEVLDSGQMVRKTRVRRLCETVEALAFRTDNSGITQAILSNCPRLRTMEGSKITVTEIVNGAEWVSTELTSLVLDLEADVDQETEEGMAKARIAFRQLGRLTQLNSLAIAAGCQPNGRRTLDLRLRTGLDELANLKSLKVLMFGYGYLQRIELQDAVWIVDNWPSMRYLYGRLEVPMGVDTSVYDFLKSHNISIS